MKITAAVTREKAKPFSIEELNIEEPHSDEVLVRVTATGICHPDLIVRDQWLPVLLPIVLGHEGAGIVERVGQSVTKVQPDGHVVLSYGRCGRSFSASKTFSRLRFHWKKGEAAFLPSA